MNVEELDLLKKGQKLIKKPSVIAVSEEKVPQKRKEGEKATDDYHYERFKKQFRRY